MKNIINKGVLSILLFSNGQFIAMDSFVKSTMCEASQGIVQDTAKTNPATAVALGAGAVVVGAAVGVRAALASRKRQGGKSDQDIGYPITNPSESVQPSVDPSEEGAPEEDEDQIEMEKWQVEQEEYKRVSDKKRRNARKTTTTSEEVLRDPAVVIEDTPEEEVGIENVGTANDIEEESLSSDFIRQSQENLLKIQELRESTNKLLEILEPFSEPTLERESTS